MCTRYFIEENDTFSSIASAPLTSSMIDKLARPFTTSGEIRPTNIVPVYATSKSRKISLFPMVWGFKLEASRPLIINARFETVADKPTFQESWLHHRCAVPASYFYEWEHIIRSDGKKVTGDKFMIQPIGMQGFYFAGLYRFEEQSGLKYPVFTIITRDASEDVKEIHDRMPVMIKKDDVREWINPEGNPEKVMERALVEMMCERVEKGQG